MIYIIEHLDDELYKWSLLEYTHISKIVGKENVLFTNIKYEKDAKILSKIGKVEEKSVIELSYLNKNNTCILELDGKQKLSLNETFKYYIFGGILGDHPPQGRTRYITEKLNFPKRCLGNKQMSTDTAVIVSHEILENKKKFSDLKFQDGFELQIDEGFSNYFPFRYLKKNNKVVLTPGLKEYLKEEDISNC